jgi:hypothetical protein
MNKQEEIDKIDAILKARAKEEKNKESKEQ